MRQLIYCLVWTHRADVDLSRLLFLSVLKTGFQMAACKRASASKTSKVSISLRVAQNRLRPKTDAAVDAQVDVRTPA